MQDCRQVIIKNFAQNVNGSLKIKGKKTSESNKMSIFTAVKQLHFERCCILDDMKSHDNRILYIFANERTFTIDPV